MITMRAYVRRILCHAGLFLFPVLKRISSAVYNHPCYWQSYLLFHSLPEEQQHQIRINILLGIPPDTEPWGHCWLTRQGQPFGHQPSQLNTRLEYVGSSGIYDYWIPISETEQI